MTAALDFNPIELTAAGDDPRAQADAERRAELMRPYTEALEAAEQRVAELEDLRDATERGEGLDELAQLQIRGGLAGEDELRKAAQEALNARRRLENAKVVASKGRAAFLKRLRCDREPAFDAEHRERVQAVWDLLQPALKAHAKLREFEEHRGAIQGGSQRGYQLRSLRPEAIAAWLDFARKNLRLNVD